MAAAIGTIVPQGSPAPEYLATISPAKYQLYKALGFFDMSGNVMEPCWDWYDFYGSTTVTNPLRKRHSPRCQ